MGARLVVQPGPWTWRVYTRGVLPPEWHGVSGFEEVVCPPRRAIRGGRLWSEQVSWGRELSRRPVDLLACLAFFPPRGFCGPFVMMVHDLTVLERPDDYPRVVQIYAGELLRSLVPRATRLTTPSEWVRQRCATLLGYPIERIDVVHSGVEPMYRLETSADRSATLLASLGVRGPFWLSCGTLQPRKNLEVVVRALGLLRQRRQELPFLVSVGRSGGHAGHLLALARRLGVSDRLVLAGRLDDGDLAALYRSCAAFVYPSWAEGFGVPPLEAMAAGAPVMAARATCLPEILGDSPFWADPGGPESWLEGWDAVRGEPAPDAAARRSRGLEWAGRYTWDATARLWRESLEKAAGELGLAPQMRSREQAGRAERPLALVLTPRFPWPLDDGGRIALWQVLWSAAQAYRVVLVSLVTPGTENDPLPARLTELNLEVIRIPHRPLHVVLAAWQGMIGPWPYTLARYRNRSLDATLRHLVETRNPAFALVNNLHLATYVDALGNVPMILREQNVEHVWMQRYASHLGRGARGWYARVQAQRLRAAEAGLCRRASLVLAIQEGEARVLRELCTGTPIETLPLGIDLSRFPSPRRAEPPIVLVAGSFAWAPNAQGAMRFLAEVWPRVADACPEARLRLAGKDPPRELRNAAIAAGAEIAVNVESMEEEFSQAKALVVPLWVGAGARVKIVEAFAARLPVVSTSIGVEGLDVTQGKHYIGGDSPVELADGLVALLKSADLGRALVHEARLLVEQRWSLEAVAGIQNRLCARFTPPAERPASTASCMLPDR